MMSVKITILSDLDTEAMFNDLAFRAGVSNENRSVQHRVVTRKYYYKEHPGEEKPATQGGAN
jgi:hypothetical protein